MDNEFTTVIEKDGDWFVAWSPEIPGANGQGHTLQECRQSLTAAIQLILCETHDKWFRARMQQALSDTRPDIPHEKVEEQLRHRREAARRKAR